MSKRTVGNEDDTDGRARVTLDEERVLEGVSFPLLYDWRI